MRLRERSASSTRRCSLESLIRRLGMGRALVAFSRPSLTGRNHWTPRPSTGSWSPAVSRLRSAAYVSIQTRRCLIEQDVLSVVFMPQESWWVGSSTTTIREVVALWPGQCSDAALALVRGYRGDRAERNDHQLSPLGDAPGFLGAPISGDSSPRASALEVVEARVLVLRVFVQRSSVSFLEGKGVWVSAIPWRPKLLLLVIVPLIASSSLASHLSGSLEREPVRCLRRRYEFS